MSNDYSSYAGLMAVLGGFIFVLVILAIIMYVFMALGMQAMAKKLGIENSWLAWIPVANLYLMGKIAGDQVTIFKKDIPKLSLVLVIGCIALMIISAIPVIGQLAAIAYAVISFVAMYKIYRIFAEGSAALFLVLSIVINITAPFLMFFASKNDPNMAIFNEGNYTGYRPSPSPSYAPASTVIPQAVMNPAPEPASSAEPSFEPAIDPVVEPSVEATAAPDQADAPSDSSSGDSSEA